MTEVLKIDIKKKKKKKKLFMVFSNCTYRYSPFDQPKTGLKK